MYVVIHSLTQVILATNIAESSITVPDIKYGEISAKLENLLVPKKDFQLFQPKEVEKVLVAVGASACCVSLSLCVYVLCLVVDFCMVKQLLTDQETGFDRLVTTWASKAALKQRKGRAGRVSAGRCYRLIKREFFRKYCPNYSVPEMQVRGRGRGVGWSETHSTAPSITHLVECYS